MTAAAKHRLLSKFPGFSIVGVSKLLSRDYAALVNLTRRAIYFDDAAAPDAKIIRVVWSDKESCRRYEATTR